MTHAIEMGQFLTIVFQPDGFDAYDLWPMARARRPDLSRAEVTTHRAPSWRRYFEQLVRGRLKIDSPNSYRRGPVARLTGYSVRPPLFASVAAGTPRMKAM